jgi:hypothetical protein
LHPGQARAVSAPQAQFKKVFAPLFSKSGHFLRSILLDDLRRQHGVGPRRAVLKQPFQCGTTQGMGVLYFPAQA